MKVGKSISEKLEVFHQSDVEVDQGRGRDGEVADHVPGRDGEVVDQGQGRDGEVVDQGRGKGGEVVDQGRGRGGEVVGLGQEKEDGPGTYCCKFLSSHKIDFNEAIHY